MVSPAGLSEVSKKRYFPFYIFLLPYILFRQIHLCLKPPSTYNVTHVRHVSLCFLFSPPTSLAANHSDAPAACASAPFQTFLRGFKRRSLPIKVDKCVKMRALQTLTLLLLLHQVRRMNERQGLKMCRFLSFFRERLKET